MAIRAMSGGNMAKKKSLKPLHYSERPFVLFFLPKLLYVPFVLARDHLGKLEMEK